MKYTLIKMLGSQDTPDIERQICDIFQEYGLCDGIQCPICPFCDRENFKKLIEELKQEKQ